MSKLFEDKNAKHINRFIFLVVGLVVVLIAYVIMVNLAPYEPYDLRSYEPVVSEACAGDPTTVLVDRTIDENATIDTIIITGYWIDEEGTRIGDVTAPVSKNDGEDSNKPFTSSVFSSAPPIEGVWYPNSYIEVEGSVLGWPRTQKLYGFGETPLTVIDCEGENNE